MDKYEYLMSVAKTYATSAETFANNGNQPLADEYRKWSEYCVERAKNLNKAPKTGV